MDKKKFWELANIEKGIGSSTEEALLDVYRTLLIKEFLHGGYADNPYKLLELLKQVPVPYIKGDEKLFFEAYRRINELTERGFVEYVNFLLCNGKSMGAMIPECLAAILFQEVLDQESILVTDCDRYGVELYDLIKENKSIKFYLTVRIEILGKIFAILYKSDNVEFINSDYYADSFTTKKFDLILSFPLMGGRCLETKGDFISREPSFIALQNLLYHLTSSGKLIIILPAKIGFGGGDAETLRHYISDCYKINKISALPARIFYPYMAINTYLISISQGVTDAVSISKYEMTKSGENDIMEETDSELLFSDELAEMNSWNIDMAFSLMDETLQHYKDSTVKKAILRDVADVFRGKAISAKDEDGNIAVVNISNISETGIDYENLDTIVDDERKVARYLLENGDVLITTKGFAVKVAVFEKQPRLIIPSSNLCVIRPNSRLLNGIYLKLFLESETGMKLIKSFQRGSSIININYQDICELEVPVPPLDEQCEIANEYNAGLNLYKKTVAAAEEAWKLIKNSVKNKLF